MSIGQRRSKSDFLLLICKFSIATHATANPSCLPDAFAPRMKWHLRRRHPLCPAHGNMRPQRIDIAQYHNEAESALRRRPQTSISPSGRQRHQMGMVKWARSALTGRPGLRDGLPAFTATCQLHPSQPRPTVRCMDIQRLAGALTHARPAMTRAQSAPAALSAPISLRSKRTVHNIRRVALRKRTALPNGPVPSPAL